MKPDPWCVGHGGERTSWGRAAQEATCCGGGQAFSLADESRVPVCADMKSRGPVGRDPGGGEVCMSLAGRSSGWFRRACLRQACQPRVHHVAQSAASYELRCADSQRKGQNREAGGDRGAGGRQGSFSPGGLRIATWLERGDLPPPLPFPLGPRQAPEEPSTPSSGAGKVWQDIKGRRAARCNSLVEEAPGHAWTMCRGLTVAPADHLPQGPSTLG